MAHRPLAELDISEFGRLAPDVAITPYPVVPDKYENFLIMREYTKYIAAYVRSLL